MRHRDIRRLADHRSAPTIGRRRSGARRPGRGASGVLAAVDAELALIVEHRSALSTDRRALG